VLAGPWRRIASRGRLWRPGEQYRDTVVPHRLGRRRRTLTALQRRAIMLLLRRHPDWGVATLRRALPGLPRNTTTRYVRRLRRVQRRRRRRYWRVLRWHLEGAVWAIDGTWLDQPVAPFGRRALIVVELHSRKVLVLRAVAGERAVAAEQVLAALIAEHGAPLVLKLDNGSAFTARRFAKFCKAHGISLLYSPVRRPRYNGTCEVRGRWAKRDALAAAQARGASAGLCQADLDCAVTFTGDMPRVSPLLRQHFLQVVEQQLAIVTAEHGLATDATLGDHVRRSLARVAVRRALQLCHILTIEGREYRQCLPASAA
jgi:transposase InsO family protein